MSRFGRSVSAGLLMLGTAYAVLFFVLSAGPVFADKLFAPEWLWERGIGDKTNPLEIANTHLQIPYRDDGTLDNAGRFTTFTNPSVFFNSPGLNCSGLVLSVCRFLFDKNWTLEEATRDRQGNSGPNAPLGKDWDFGWDLVLNLTDGTSRRVIMPDDGTYDVQKEDGNSLRGFDMHDSAAWGHVLQKMRPGYVYLGSISRPAHREGYQLLHYHVVLMLPDAKGGIWLYHATRRSNVHRININTARGLARFMSQFSNSRNEKKKIFIVEAQLPKLDAEPTPGSDATQPPPQPDAKPTPPPGPASKPFEQEQPERRGASPDDANNQQSAPTPQEAENAPAQPTVLRDDSPQVVLNHLSGKVYKSFPGINTAIPRLSHGNAGSIIFWFGNVGSEHQKVELSLKGPSGTSRYDGTIPSHGRGLVVHYPSDFQGTPTGPLQLGKYMSEVRLDGVPWLADVFEVAAPREAAPKIVRISAPSTVQAGRTFNVKIEALNTGAESDYGGITVSSSDPSGLRIKSASPGKVYGAGSTVLSVTSDRIRTKVPMAERWIELWGEKAPYDMNLKIEAGRPGTYDLYVRCALRGVNVKSSVILMDPKQSSTVDQQGFPVHVHRITVQ